MAKPSITIVFLLSVSICSGHSSTNKTSVPDPDPVGSYQNGSVTTESNDSPTSSAFLNITGASMDKQDSSFKNDEKAVFKSVDSLMRQLLAQVMRRSSSVELSPHCMSSMMKIFVGMRKLRGWALRMIDSYGKFSSGILEGTYSSMGHYDQCLSVSVTKKGEPMKLSDDNEQLMFSGKYCVIRLKQRQSIIEAARGYHEGSVSADSLGKLKEMIQETSFSSNIPNYMSHFLGVCFPSTCNEEDVHKILQNLPFAGEASLEECQTQSEKEVSIGQKCAIAAFVLLGAMVAIGSTVDKFVQIYSGDHATESKRMSLVTSFSIWSNTRKLMNKIQNDSIEYPDSRNIRGIVFGAIICLIIHQTYFSPYDAFYKQASNLSNLRKYLKEPYFAVTICLLPLAVETLFLAYGFTLSNKIWRSTWKEKTTVHVPIVGVIITEYLRLCIPLLFCLGIIVLLPLFGSGPFWNEVFGTSVDKCSSHWYSLVLMYANFLNVEDQCFPHFWLVPCLMQLITISTTLLWLISRWPKLGVCVTLCLMCACNVTVGVLTTQADLPPSFVQYFSASRSSYFWHINYALPVSHFGSFATGLLLGVFMARKAHLRMKPFLSVIGWLISISILIGVCVFVLYSYHGPNSMSTTASGIYAALHRTLYSLSVSWIILACSYGHGCSINSILSWSVLDPLYKISYFAYLLHGIVIAYGIGTAREKFNYSHFDMISKCVSYSFMSYAAAYLCHVFSEMPLKIACAHLYPTRSDEFRITTVSKDRRSKGDDVTAYYENYDFPRPSVVVVSNSSNGIH